MNILFACANYTYPPKEGMHVQFTLLLKQMQKMGHQCYLVAYVRDGFEFDMQKFSGDCPEIKVCRIVPTPSGYSSLALKNVLRNILPRRAVRQSAVFVDALRSVCVQHSIDVVHLEGIPLAPDLAVLRMPPVLFSTVDAWSLRQRRVMQRAKALMPKLFRFGGYCFSKFLEKTYFPRAAAIHVVSEEDAAYLRGLLPATRIVTIPVSMDARLESVQLADLPLHEPGLLLFSGDIRVDYIRDGLAWLFDQVWPRLQVPGLRMRVLGRAMPDRELARKAAACGTIEFVDWVDDFDAELARAAAVVLPDQTGTGLKNRLIHALALARPVVATSVVAEGIHVRSGVHMLIADSAEDFAQALESVLLDHGYAASLGQEGRQRMFETYAPQHVAGLWDSCYRSLVAAEKAAD